ncbi:hypothetical protein, partial [Caldithrix abyssi]
RLLSVAEATVDCEVPSIECAPPRLHSGQAFDFAPFGSAQGAGIRLLSVVEATVDCEVPSIDCAPFGSAQGAGIRLLSVAEATVDFKGPSIYYAQEAVRKEKDSTSPAWAGDVK